VGHSTDFTKRKYKHKDACNGTRTQQYVHRFINANGGFSNWDMIMVEKYPCTDVYEACAKERFYIEQLNADLNQISPPTGLTTSEYQTKYRKENPEKCKEKHEKYYIENVDKIKDFNSTKFCCIICRKELQRYSFNSHYNRKHNND
jgi:hypothetical protein